METGIHVGNKIDAKEAAKELADAVVRVLEAINENGTDRETGLKALDVVAMAGQPGPTNITNSHIEGGDRSYPTYVYPGASRVDSDDD